MRDPFTDADYDDCELPSVQCDLRDPERFLEGHAGRRLVLDEIQRLDDPSELLKIAADHHRRVRLLATGSSSLGARAKFRDTLAGRKHEVWLTPMTYADTVAFGQPAVEHRMVPRRSAPIAIECKWSEDALDPFSWSRNYQVTRTKAVRIDDRRCQYICIDIRRPPSTPGTALRRARTHPSVAKPKQRLCRFAREQLLAVRGAALST